MLQQVLIVIHSLVIYIHTKELLLMFMAKILHHGAWGSYCVNIRAASSCGSASENSLNSPKHAFSLVL
jgi:hypothetical protein